VHGLNPFHLAIQVHDLGAAREFYGGLLGCSEGRSAETWVDFNLFGHQLVCHVNPSVPARDCTHSSLVDGHGVPVPHFGVVLDMESWKALADRLRDQVEFFIEPYIRFAGQIGEQATMFFRDPSGNAIEFKGLRDIQADLFKICNQVT
jgi:extradiol dioxygenase family protein